MPFYVEMCPNNIKMDMTFKGYTFLTQVYLQGTCILSHAHFYAQNKVRISIQSNWAGRCIYCL